MAVSPSANTTQVSQALLFVYGTLRQSIRSPMDKLMAQHGELVSSALLSGRLYELGGYPGAVYRPNAIEHVHGDLFNIHRPHQLWPKLDHYELCSPAFKKPWQFVRQKCLVTTPDGDTQQAWVYLYNYKTAGLPEIKSGNYLYFLKNGNDLSR